MSNFSGAVQRDTLVSNSVVSASTLLVREMSGNYRGVQAVIWRTRSGSYFVAAAQSPMRLPVTVMFIVSFVCFIVMRIWPS